MGIAPGVVVETESSGLKAIAMASTSLTAFIGLDLDESKFNKGKLTLISKFSQIEALLPGDLEGESGTLKDALKNYFGAGGKICYVLNADSDNFEADLKKSMDSNQEVSLICFPSAAVTEDSGTYYAKIVSYCDSRRDLVFIHDCPKDKNSSLSDAYTYFSGLGASSYATSYFPWVKVGSEAFPPSPFIAAQYGKVDANIGVHQTAAGVQNGVLPVTGLTLDISQNQHDNLVKSNGQDKALKFNLIRDINGYGRCLWGARTMDIAGEYRHLSVRRLFIFAEQSIKDSLRWVIFEPNDLQLWGKVNRSISAFLTRLWKQGALVGATADEAFYVKIDKENNPEDQRAQGFLNIVIGMAPVHPAEFVIIKLVQKTES